jgi:hypothetical protein
MAPDGVESAFSFISDPFPLCVRILSNELDVLRADEDKLGANLRAQLGYLPDTPPQK